VTSGGLGQVWPILNSREKGEGEEEDYGMKNFTNKNKY
jgi:hypothetical protein